MKELPSNYFEGCHEAGAFLAGVIITVIALIITLSITSNIPEEIDCREGKLYKVSHDGNITIYEPTYNDCEEKK